MRILTIMKHFKNHNLQSGLSFIEVILAVFMVGSMLSAALLLQSNSFFHIAESSTRFARIIMLDNKLMELARSKEAKKKPTLPAQEKITDPATTINFKSKQPSEKSSLKNCKGIAVDQIKAEWSLQGKQLEETLVMVNLATEKES